MLHIIISLISGYIVGSIPLGYIAGKIAGKDIRREGYNRIGASNVYKILGFVPAVLVFFGDFIKGIVPIYVLTLIGFNEPVATIAGISAIVGHNWPVFLLFKGEGRGIATSTGVLFYMLPLETICGVAVVIFLSILIKNSSLPIFIFICLMPILALIFPEPLWTFGIALSISILLLCTRFLGGLRYIKESRTRHRTILCLILYDNVRQ